MEFLSIRKITLTRKKKAFSRLRIESLKNHYWLIYFEFAVGASFLEKAFHKPEN